MDTKNKVGFLYICPTPIGNLGDVTFRTIEVLKNVDLIACEDTRDSKKFLLHYDIHTPLTSYHDHNRTSKGEHLIGRMLAGEVIALISDAGMPGISDPGEDLVRLCIKEGIEYTVLPGASAGITALVGSGQATKRFIFEGFLPKSGKERRERLEEIAKEKRTIILYESPHHLIRTLNDLSETMEERNITIARELTKIYEERIYTTTKKSPREFVGRNPRGEYVLVIAGRSKEEETKRRKEKFAGMSIHQQVKIYEKKGIKKNEAMKKVAADLGITKREVYALLIEEDKVNE